MCPDTYGYTLMTNWSDDTLTFLTDSYSLSTEAEVGQLDPDADDWSWSWSPDAEADALISFWSVGADIWIWRRSYLIHSFYTRLVDM